MPYPAEASSSVLHEQGQLLRFVDPVSESESAQLLKGVEIIGSRFRLAGRHVEADKIPRRWQHFQYGFKRGQELRIAVDPRILEQVERRFQGAGSSAMSRVMDRV